MADFCRDCSIAMFGRDFRDHAQLMPAENYSNVKGKEAGALVLCECCGPICVDINGRRIDGQSFHPECSCQEFTRTHSKVKAKENELE